VERCFGFFHTLPPQLQHSIIETARQGATNTRKNFDDALLKQKESRKRKEERAWHKKIDATREEYIVAIELWEKYHSQQCWKTVEFASMVYN
jgi:hypothetical protein